MARTKLQKLQESIELAVCLALIPVGYAVIAVTMAAAPSLLVVAALHRAAVGYVAADCRIRKKGWQ